LGREGLAAKERRDHKRGTNIFSNAAAPSGRPLCTTAIQNASSPVRGGIFRFLRSNTPTPRVPLTTPSLLRRSALDVWCPGPMFPLSCSLCSFVAKKSTTPSLRSPQRGHLRLLMLRIPFDVRRSFLRSLRSFAAKFLPPPICVHPCPSAVNFSFVSLVPSWFNSPTPPESVSPACRAAASERRRVPNSITPLTHSPQRGQEAQPKPRTISPRQLMLPNQRHSPFSPRIPSPKGAKYDSPG
jgi:hypothetical protein